MTTYLMEALGPAGTATRCPGCGSACTTWVATAVTGNLLCKTCGACWHTVAGRSERVDVAACPGCDLRRICTAAQGVAQG